MSTPPTFPPEVEDRLRSGRHPEAAGQPPASRVTEAAYRQLMSGFPTGVAVVTTLAEPGSPRGLTCSSLMSGTLHPPTLLVSLRTGSITLAAARECGRFAVNLLHTGGQAAAQIFANPAPERFDQVSWRLTPGLGLPWLVDDAFAVADCVIVDSVPVGGHTVLLGEVAATVCGPASPLLYGLRRYSGWPEPAPPTDVAG